MRTYFLYTRTLHILRNQRVIPLLLIAIVFGFFLCLCMPKRNDTLTGGVLAHRLVLNTTTNAATNQR
jgi:hypothetical protein